MILLCVKNHHSVHHTDSTHTASHGRVPKNTSCGIRVHPYLNPSLLDVQSRHSMNRSPKHILLNPVRWYAHGTDFKRTSTKKGGCLRDLFKDRNQPPAHHFGWERHFFVTHGASAIFWGGFIAGLRIPAGPLAGTLRMPWRRFVVFNFLGATAWVLLIATLGYFFGTQLDRLLRVIRQANLVIVAILLSAVALWYWKRQRVRAIEAKPHTQRSS